MGRRNDQEGRLLEMLNSSANRNSCGECKAHNPTWASWNLGVFLCGRCASAHRSLGEDISQVKSVSMDHWSSRELSTMERIGNRRNNEFWNEKRVPFPFDPEDKDVLVTWLRGKYKGQYRNGAVRESDYNLKGRDNTDDYGFDYGSKSSRSYGSGSIYDGEGSGMTRSMRRAHERLGDGGRLYQGSGSRGSYSGSSRDYEDRSDSYDSYDRQGRSSGRASAYKSQSTSSASKKYTDYARKMKFDMGFEDMEANIDALTRTNGNIEKAAELLRRSGLGRSERENAAPSLPRRKQTTGALFDSSKVAGFDWLGDGAQSQTSQTTQGSQAQTASLIDLDSDEQIFQYVDPNTGAVYYIDRQGQQYADPNGGQQQTMNPMQMQQAQMQMQQLQQQAIDPAMQQQAMQQQAMQQQAMQQQAMQQQAMLQQQAQMQQQQQQQPQIYQQQPSKRAPTLAELQNQQQMQLQMQQMQHMLQMQQYSQYHGF